ncbi:peptidase M20D/carboxypeptidase Ss1 [Dissoconium aciculare CBS 342.82]|uniref:Peptidase M20D/carboxypeptidase Ss1 n=1 Tax=Dissoconium aciculare CBS 342.82 TaxID=1314786 RepID=A0A6J3MGI5_9PEZI|nr:peptidase M20D/carboxypeptidase Ss1 [Dissoconium aciculare CBS 342.82]KAF1827065.1 peptidase M20D/carboxypeptidase Ss1 [Dissoconium aciculare CBS 342.82]
MRLQEPFERWRSIIEASFPDLGKYSSIYKDLHEHPELPCQEARTAATVANHLAALGFHVQKNIGGYGLVGTWANGNGRKIMLRSELDALPMKEKTGLPYASEVKQVDVDGYMKPVMHGCGHDMHMASLLAAAELLQRIKQHWTGTLMCIFQPNEERFLGAQAMIDDGLFDKIPLPDILLGQHAVPTRAGTIGIRAGRVLGFLDSLNVRVYGKGTHSSTPESGVDPILMASCIISRLQMVVTREIGPKQPCVVTCGTFHAGTDASIIPEYADFKVDVRSLDMHVQLTAVKAVKRIIIKECQTSNAPREPRITTTASCPPVDNDEDCTRRFEAALRSFYGSEAREKIISMDLDVTSDDFVLLAHPPGKPQIPYVYWNFGVTPRVLYDRAEREGTLNDLPINHSPMFAPEIVPSLQAGIEAWALAAMLFFGDH